MRLEDVKKDAIVTGILHGQEVRIVSVDTIGPDTINVIYRTSTGAIAEKMLFRSDEPTLGLASAGRTWVFDANGEDFKLVAEAYRIHLAHLFDPLMAVHTSNIEPLPHQITAVYESMLPRQPLRYLLADDPGAGKTIMAGLYTRETLLRGDVKRCLIIAPGSLVEQWQDEMDQKFGMKFKILSRETIEASGANNPFDDPHSNLLICRMDQLSRNDDLKEKIKRSALWDLVIVDEAHKLAASYFGSELKKTKRYQLGEAIGQLTRNFLLMTATPHNGKEEDFQLFMALLDSDRFYGKFRDGIHQGDAHDLMRRMIKEELLKFDGTRLFPERRAYTVNYKLSNLEAALYASVTQYVREEMNRADNLDSKRRGTVGFALTVLQRRLASSPEAIFKSIERRRKNLEKRLEEEKLNQRGALLLQQDILPKYTEEEVEDYVEDAPDKEVEELEETVVSKATAARTIAELEAEIRTLKVLEAQAHEVRMSGQDRKWEELSRLLQDNPEMFDSECARRKLIIFTEHRDTLRYLHEKIAGLLGSAEPIVIIHGSVRREERKKAQERFTQDKKVLILLATDAAGEGINLQRANLMVNYDLPWNPNRLEQRFGRIHRIGQREVCHLWNLVANETREGDVYQRLLEKLEAERKALGGRVFDILGEVFSDRSLKALLMEAIRYGEDPAVRRKLYERVESALDTERLKEIMERTALVTEHMDSWKVFAVKEEMEKARAKKLQPYFINSFFMAAFGKTGGKVYEREPKRFEVTHVPSRIRQRDRVIGMGQPVLRTYERICFEREKVNLQGLPLASLVCPGHPLMDSMIDIVLEDYRPLLNKGAVLVDPADEGTIPRILFVIDHSIRDGLVDRNGQQRVISRRLQFINVHPDGSVSPGGHAPYLDFRPATDQEMSLVKDIGTQPWVKRDLESVALQHAANTVVADHLREVKSRRERMVEITKNAVHERLIKEITFWDHMVVELQDRLKAGLTVRMQPETAQKKLEELTERLEKRMNELEAQRNLSSSLPVVVSAILVVPQGLLNKQAGAGEQWCEDPEARVRIERIAMNAVMGVEKALGYEPVDVSREKCGWDVTSRVEAGNLRFVEVKGRSKGGATVTVTKNEILTCFNQPEKYLLAIVMVSDNDEIEGPFYIRQPFKQEPDFGVTSVNYDIGEMLKIAENMHEIHAGGAVSPGGK